MSAACRKGTRGETAVVEFLRTSGWPSLTAPETAMTGLLRQYFPKGSDLSVHGDDHLALVAAELNARPRKTLGWRTPGDVLATLQDRPGTPAGSTPLTLPAASEPIPVRVRQ